MVTQALRMLRMLRMLRRFLHVTQSLRNDYAGITQSLRRHYAGIRQSTLKRQLRSVTLRNSYAVLHGVTRCYAVLRTITHRATC